MAVPLKRHSGLLRMGRDNPRALSRDALRCQIGVCGIPGLLKGNLIRDGGTLKWSWYGAVVHSHRCPDRAVIVDPLGVRGGKADTARGPGDSKIIVGAGPHGIWIRRVVNNGMHQDGKSGPKACGVLGVHIIDHQTPAVLLRCLECAHRGVVAAGAQERL